LCGLHRGCGPDDQLVETNPHLLACGRLGEYSYYDMDQAIGRAMTLARRVLEQEAA
jgi:UDP-galactopyranose mutase